jgi:hypothetical protein
MGIVLSTKSLLEGNFRIDAVIKDDICQFEVDLQALREHDDETFAEIIRILADIRDNGYDIYVTQKRMIFDRNDHYEKARVFELKRWDYRLFGFLHPRRGVILIFSHVWKKEDNEQSTHRSRQVMEFSRVRELRDEVVEMLGR